MAIDKNFIMGYGAGKASKTNQTIIEETDAWLEENISQETGYVLDRTLTLQNAAAPADMVGDLKTALNTDISVIENESRKPISFNWEHGGIDNATGLTNNDGSTTRSRDITYYAVENLYSVTNGSSSALWIIFYTKSGNTYSFVSSTSVSAGASYPFNAGEYVRFDVRGSLEQAALVSGLYAYSKIVDDVLTSKIGLNGLSSVKFGVPDVSECTTKISATNAKIIRFSAVEAPFDGASLGKLLFKTIPTTLTNYRFWIGRLTNDEKIKLVATFVVPTIDTKTEYVNGVDFDFDFPIRKGDLIGIQILANIQNAYYGGTSGSYNYIYTGDSKPGDELAFETKSYGISLGATYRALGINEKIEAIDGKFDNSHLSFAMDDVICIGDSLTRGSPPGNTLPSPLKQNYPYFLSRMLNCDCENAGVAGISTKTWYNSYYNNYTMANYNTFIIFLGTNGGLTNTLATDVDPYDDYNDFADTQTGYYCRIIEHILEDRSDAFIVLVNTWDNASGQDETRIAIKAIGEKYQLPVVNTVEVMPYSMNPTYHGNVDNVHCSKAGYLALANLIREKVTEYIAVNPSVANLGMTQDS